MVKVGKIRRIEQKSVPANGMRTTMERSRRVIAMSFL